MKKLASWFFIAFCLFLLAQIDCKPGMENKTGQLTDTLTLSVKQEPFGQVDGQDIQLFTLKNPSGMTVYVTNYGGIVTQLWVPDRNGNPGDVVLGYDSLSSYI
ncbi:MAG: hypothetical protein FJY10_07190 [Bacteroidetes bacterium]|nr:hypothetical protein [Bacteroidota bacterium]